MVLFHSFTQSGPQRLAQSGMICDDRTFLDTSRSLALGFTSVIVPLYPYLQGSLPMLQLMPSCSSSATTDHRRSLNQLNWFVRNACTLGSSLFQLAMLAPWKCIAHPAYSVSMCEVTSCSLLVLPESVPVTAQSITPRCRAGVTSPNGI